MKNARILGWVAGLFAFVNMANAQIDGPGACEALNGANVPAEALRLATGGVSVTTTDYVSASARMTAENGDIVAFDTGPGNALLDDWMARRVGTVYDAGGRLAASGRVDQDALTTLLQAPYFDRPPPKSLDRDAFRSGDLGGLTPADGAATLAAFTVEAVVRGARFLPRAVRRWLVCGGGRKNETLMRGLADALNVPVEPVEAVGWSGDAIEAQAFAFLAARSLYGLPISLPSTTGVERPLAGGTLHRP